MWNLNKLKVLQFVAVYCTYAYFRLLFLPEKFTQREAELQGQSRDKSLPQFLHRYYRAYVLVYFIPQFAPPMQIRFWRYKLSLKVVFLAIGIMAAALHYWIVICWTLMKWRLIPWWSMPDISEMLADRHWWNCSCSSLVYDPCAPLLKLVLLYRYVKVIHIIAWRPA